MSGLAEEAFRREKTPPGTSVGDARRRSGGTGTGLSDANAAAVGDGVVDQKQDDGADDRAEQPRGAQATVGGVVTEEDVGQEAADEGAEDAEGDGGADTHGVTAGNQEPGQRTGDEADDEQAE